MPVQVSIEQEELRGISRTVAEIHWLLLILILLYLMLGGVAKENEPAISEPAISSALFFYAALVMAFRYANFFRAETRWKIAVETLAMIAVITWSLWFTGKLQSPLLNAYLLVVITSALTLGKLTTLVEVALIGACYVFLAGGTSFVKLASLSFAGALAAQIAPVLLVAYITTMFSADIRYALQRAKLLSELDELTGLFNTRGFAIAADRLFGQAMRYARPASVLMIDLDNLKAVNDAYGHEAGNRLLRHTANALRAQLRYTDVAARYGGDEFIVLLPETPPRGALDVAERIRKAVADSPLDMDAGKIASSVSIGVACFPDDGRTLDALATRADRALYEAKQKGRNCVFKYRVD
jgi:diguanylate cyclase (GGDEF)-like protein